MYVYIHVHIYRCIKKYAYIYIYVCIFTCTAERLTKGGTLVKALPLIRFIAIAPAWGDMVLMLHACGRGCCSSGCASKFRKLSGRETVAVGFLAKDQLLSLQRSRVLRFWL